MTSKPASFRERVFAIVCKIPSGKVASYGQIAALVGSPRAARQVGWAMATAPADGSVPWWRVVNRDGYLSIRGEDLDAKLTQKALLELENVTINSDLILDMKKYQIKSID